MNAQIKIDIAKPFYLDCYLVNPKTGVITHDESETNLEPKVMQVLLLLVDNAGELVTQETIFRQVWPNSIFSASSIQRCITLLRKVFADDARLQAVIKTHPKRGYSLHAKLKSESQLESTKKNIYLIPAVLFFILVASVLIGISLFSEPQNIFSKVDLTPLSSTENNEYFARYSPDLTNVAYIQETVSGESEIWLRNNQTDEHRQLTYNGLEKLSLTWSDDNHTIIFAELDYLKDETVFHIKRISIKSGEEPLPVKLITEIKNLIFISDIHWSSDSYIYYIGRTINDKVIFKHNLMTNETVELIQFEAAVVPQTLALSSDGQKLAVVVQGTQMNNELKVFNHNGQLIEDKGKVATGELEINWHPNNQAILLNDGNKLSVIARNNQIQPINYTSLSSIANASFAGANAISFTLDKVDSDIYRYNLNNTKAKPELIINSNQIDHSARLSTEGNKIAFISRRAGNSQIYIRELDKEQLVYRNKANADYLSSPLWRDEASIFVSIDGRLNYLNIDNQQLTAIQFEPEKYILHLLSWDANSQTINLAYLQDDNVYVAALVLPEKTISIIRKLKPQQAAHTFSDNKFVLIKNNALYEIRGPEKEVLLNATLAENIDMSVGRRSGIYYQTQDDGIHTLWHFSYPERRLTKLFDVPPNQLLIDVSYDEQTALFRSITHEKDIVVIKSVP